MTIKAKMFSQRAAPIGAEGSVLCGACESLAEKSEDDPSSEPEPEPEAEPPPADGIFGALGAVGAVGALGILTLHMPLGKPTISTYLVAESELIEDEEAQGEDE